MSDRRLTFGRLQVTRLGLFESEVDAARAYDAAAREMFGEWARLNFPAAALVRGLGETP